MPSETWYRRLIHILQERIDEAIRRHSSMCMVSEAIEHELPVTRVMTDSATIRMTHRATGYRYIFLTPQIVQEYIADWDEQREIKPFNFRLGNPIQIVKSKKRKPVDNKPLDVTTASSREVKDAINKGKDIVGKTVINHSPANKDRKPVIIGGDPPPHRKIFGPMRRYGFRGLARRYEDIEAAAYARGKAEAEAETKNKTNRK